MVSRSTKVLFIEGTSDDTNGDLGRGFSALLKQKLASKMPRVIMGNGISETIDKYKNAKSYSLITVLVDLDGKGDMIRQGEFASSIETKRNYHELTDKDLIYFMIQKMESWFLSQPNVLKDYFKKEFKKIPFDHVSKIESPDIELMKMTRDLKFKSYHKVRDGSRLLERLNLEQLENTFPDVKEMIIKLT